MKNLTNNAAGKVVTKAVSKVATASTVNPNLAFYNKAKEPSMVSLSNYLKNGKLTIAEGTKVMTAALKVYEGLKDVKKEIASLYAKEKDFNGKPYRRIERVFSAMVAKELGLSTSTVHEKLTETVNITNRPCIKLFIKFSDADFDKIRVLVYKFKI